MTDEERLDEITAAFTKALIKHKFDDRFKYIELAKRLSALMNAEIIWQDDQDWQRFLMQAWGADAN